MLEKALKADGTKQSESIILNDRHKIAINLEPFVIVEGPDKVSIFMFFKK